MGEQKGDIQRHQDFRDYTLKVSRFQPRIEGRSSRWERQSGIFCRRSRPLASANDPSWTAASTGVYLEMLNHPVIGPLNKRPDCTFQFRRTDPRWHYPILAGGHNIRSTTVKEYPENILKWPATWSLGTCFNVHESHRIARHFQETENR